MNESHPIRILRAGPAEISKLVAHMPRAAQAPTQRNFYAAVDGGELAGGAAISAVAHGPRGIPEVSFQIALLDGADPEAGDMLTQAMKVIARRRGAELLVHEGAVRDGSWKARMLERCNFFMRGEKLSVFSTRTDNPEWERFIKTHDRLKRRGKIPGDITVAPFNKLSQAAVQNLLMRSIGNTTEDYKYETLNPNTVSIGVQQGAKLLGVHVVTIDKTTAHTSSVAVDTSHRGSWVYAVLLTEVLRVLRRNGINDWQYKTNPGINRAILNSSRKINARLLGDESTWVFPLE